VRILLRAGALVAAVLAFPAAAFAGTSAGQPFPTNLDTVPDSTQVTGLRIDLPSPNCTSNPSDCADIAVLNSLDGFNIQPRISIPFSGPIDPSTVSSSTIFLIGPHDDVIGVNQPVWNPGDNTLYVESNDQLEQDSTYLLVVTRGLHDAAGRPLDVTDFRQQLNFGQTDDPAVKAYRKALLDALPSAFVAGVNPGDVADASLFTTQSVTAISEKIRDQIRSAPAPVANFNLGPGGARTVFPNAPGLSITWNRQVTTVGPLSPSPTQPPVLATQIFPGSISAIAYGSFPSRDYENNLQVIPPVGTKTGVPAVQSINNLVFTLFVPSGLKPAGGWPVAIFGHGFTDSENGAPWVVASSLAHAGIATIAINVVGHGFGAASTYTVTSGGTTETFNAGGRGFDQDGNGVIDSTEGVNAANGSIVGDSDGLRQTVFDIDQLVRMLQNGVDVNGDGSVDLSTSRIYYTGQSFGGIYGVQLLGLEPTIHAGVTNVAGGPIVEIARLSPSFRGLVGGALFFRTPSLYNTAHNATFTNFIENEPLRDLPIVIDTVPGAEAIQQYLDNSEWAQQPGNPEGWAPHIAMPIIFQFARTDQTVPNPTSTRVIRAGGLQSRVTMFRNDLANAAIGTSKNPHTFLTNITGPGAGCALAAQTQIATFFATDGANMIDPNALTLPGTQQPLCPFFENAPSTLPEDLDYIP
jgi:Big-like domain-containing protein